MSQENIQEAPRSQSFMNMKTLHIVAEVLAMCGMVAYFYKRNLTLMAKIDELTKRLDDHDEMVQNHETALKKIVEKLKKVN